MVALSLAFLALFGLSVGARGWVFVRRTGTSPFRAGTANGKLAVCGYAFVFTVPPVLDATHILPRLVRSPWAAAAGVALAILGCAGTVLSAFAMGDSWRIGVDETERTTLVTAGVYRVIRNPIYTAMVAFAIGMALLEPNLAAILAVAAVLLAVELVVRSVEEPYLARMHGSSYADWASRAGRFLPGVGTLRT